MEIRLDLMTEGQKTIVSVAGRLSGVAVAQLKNVCDPIEGALVLELLNLLSADAEGIDFIRTLGRKGAEIRGASPFIQLLLDN